MVAQANQFPYETSQEAGVIEFHRRSGRSELAINTRWVVCYVYGIQLRLPGSLEKHLSARCQYQFLKVAKATGDVRRCMMLNNSS